jgi:hypothetical protein
MDTFIYWLSQSPEGARMVMRGSAGIAHRISTHAIEAEMRRYARVDDCIGNCNQIVGHNFYKLHFPTADITWVWDEATQLWHKEHFSDVNGAFHRRNACFPAYAYQRNLMLDWSNGNLYLDDPDNMFDALTGTATSPGKKGAPVVRRRGLPHMINGEFDRVSYWRLIADIDNGDNDERFGPFILQSTRDWDIEFSGEFGPAGYTVFPPFMSLRKSKTRGHTWENRITQLMGGTGQYGHRVAFRRLGYGGDTVFELEWSAPVKTALNGVYLLTEEHMYDSGVHRGR